MTMTPLLLFLLAASPEVYNAKPNIFEPKEMSSEAIYVSVQMCLNQHEPMTKATLALCGCAVDAIRLNLKQGKADPAATAEQVQRCGGPLPVPAKKPVGKVGT
jgi:hypothetical protein